jgi:hypothetical protein
MPSGFTKNVTSSVAVAAAAATIAGAISIGLRAPDMENAALEATINEVNARLEAAIAKDVSAIRGEIKRSIDVVLDSSRLPDDTEVALRFQKIDARLEELGRQLKIVKMIELAITENPERAMSIPILRKDIDLLRKNVVDDIGATRKEIDRIYDLGKWFIGLMATMAIGVMGLAVGNLLKGKE